MIQNAAVCGRNSGPELVAGKILEGTYPVVVYYVDGVSQRVLDAVNGDFQVLKNSMITISGMRYWVEGGLESYDNNTYFVTEDFSVFRGGVSGGL